MLDHSSNRANLFAPTHETLHIGLSQMQMSAQALGLSNLTCNMAHLSEHMQHETRDENDAHLPAAPPLMYGLWLWGKMASSPVLLCRKQIRKMGSIQRIRNWSGRGSRASMRLAMIGCRRLNYQSCSVQTKFSFLWKLKIECFFFKFFGGVQNIFDAFIHFHSMHFTGHRLYVEFCCLRTALFLSSTNGRGTLYSGALQNVSSFFISIFIHYN